MVKLIDCAKGRCKSRFEVPDPGDVYAPWVSMRFKKGDRVITVGNKSSYTVGNRDGGDHTACIKSFEYATTDGFRCTIVIHDQQGGSFATFMRHIITSLEPTHVDFNEILVSFGWIRILCDGTQLKHPPDCTFLMHGLEIEVTYTEGIFLYTFTGMDLGQYMIESAKFEGVIGEDGMDEGGVSRGVPLAQAIRTMFTDRNFETNSPPYVKEVRFLQDMGFGNDPQEVEIYHGNGQSSVEGPPGKWPGNQRDKMNAAKDWIKDHPAVVKAKDGNVIHKAFRPAYNSCGGKEEIVFWADNAPVPCETNTDDRLNVGCYYVNGGKDSRVIEFSPKIKTNFGLLAMAGGNMEGGVAFNKDANKVADHPCTNTTTREGRTYKSAGTDTSAVADDFVQNSNKKNAGTVAGEGQALQSRALSLSFLPVQAQMTIVGDPRFMAFTHLRKTVTIIFINPFHLLPVPNEGGCGEWLAKPVCNEVLTNKGWFIETINHKIQEGSFTTTLDLFLPIPDISLDQGANFGADPMGFKL